MKDLKDYIRESILDSDDSLRARTIAQFLNNDQTISKEDVKFLEKQVAVWKPEDDDEMYKVARNYVSVAGNKCSLNWFDTSEITDLTDFFAVDILSKFNGDISKWDVSKVTNLNSTFTDSMFNGNLSKWDVSNVRNFNGTFARSKFNKPLKNWNVSRGEYFVSMFEATSFDQDISNWDMECATDTERMFKDCPIKEKNKPTFT